MIRVGAGEFKRRKLLTLKSTDTRPTADKVKGAIFSMVKQDTPGAVCLDLFAGTGALGIEALSRGAERVYFCDRSKAAVIVLRKNLALCGIDDQKAVVIVKDWHAALSMIEEKCNLVFIDAPYNMCEYYPQILESLAHEHVIEKGASLVIERDALADLYVLPLGFERVTRKRYGNVGVDLLSYTGAGDRNG